MHPTGCCKLSTRRSWWARGLFLGSRAHLLSTAAPFSLRLQPGLPADVGHEPTGAPRLRLGPPPATAPPALSARKSGYGRLAAAVPPAPPGGCAPQHRTAAVLLRSPGVRADRSLAPASERYAGTHSGDQRVTAGGSRARRRRVLVSRPSALLEPEDETGNSAGQRRHVGEQDRGHWRSRCSGRRTWSHHAAIGVQLMVMTSA